MSRNDIINTDGTIKWDTVGGFKDRLDGHDASLADIVYDAKNPPVPLVGVKGSSNGNLVDVSSTIQSIINACSSNGVTELYFPDGYYYVTQSIATQGIKLKGRGIPYIPFMTWDYASPYGTNQDYQKYLFESHGAIITTDKNIPIFTDGLIAENIGLFGNRRATSVNEGVTSSLSSNPFKIKNVIISGFAGHGVDLSYGCYNFQVDESTITQNGQNGIFIDNNAGSGTGETNLVKIRDSFITHNEWHGVFGNIMGRSVSITGTDFEQTGEPSDTNRNYNPTTSTPFDASTNTTGVKYGIYLTLYNSGGYSNGCIEIEGNYSEGSYGLIGINGNDPSYGISIKKNMSRPINANYGVGASFNGWLSGVDIESNDFISGGISNTFDKVKFESNNTITNVSVDTQYTGTCHLGSKPVIHREFDQNTKQIINVNSEGLVQVGTLPSGTVTSLQYDSTYTLPNTNSPSGYGCTYIHLNTANAPSFTFGADGLANQWAGYVIAVGGNFVGVLSGYASASKVFNIRGNRSSVAIGDGSAVIYQVGGYTSINGAGTAVKNIWDWDNTLLYYGK